MFAFVRYLFWIIFGRASEWERPTAADFVLRLSLIEAFAVPLHRVLLRMRGDPLHPPRTPRPRKLVKVVCISDTHGMQPELPYGDLLIHAGDLTGDGRAASVQRQVDWLKSQPHKYKILVAGNHDEWFDENVRHPDDANATVNLEGVRYLQKSGTIVQFEDDRNFTIWGAPNIPFIGRLRDAFQYNRENGVLVWDRKVPMTTDILVTHTPPRGYLDNWGLGCEHVLNELWRVRPKLHVFGHVHVGAGREALYYDRAQQSRQLIAHWRSAAEAFGPIVLVTRIYFFSRLVIHGLISIVETFLNFLFRMSGDPKGSTLLVNAAVRIGNTANVISKNEIQVVEI